MYDNFKHSDITELIIKSFYDVYNVLGHGFLEKVYENALYISLINSGLSVEKQRSISVYYQDEKIGQYYADLIVNEKVIVELKAAKNICEEHENQLINYLKATEIEVGLLLNFGKEPEFKRKVFTNKS